MKKRNAQPLIVLLVVAPLVLTFLVTQLSAQDDVVVPDVGFEIEGNAALDHGGDYDWEAVGFPPAVLIQDPNSKAVTDPTTFRPNGKFDRPETWSILPSQVGPGQNELTNVMAWGLPPVKLGGGRPGDFWLVLGMERTKQQGTFALDFEFNQAAWDGSSGGPTRTPGDLAVGFELQGNPTDRQADLQVLIIQYRPRAQPSLCKVTPGVGKAPALVELGTDPCPPYGDGGWFYRFLADGVLFADSGLGQATMNEDPFSVPEWWLSTDAQGNPRGDIGPFQFAEAALNLTALDYKADCSTFSTVHAKSRASLEVESDLKDLAGPLPLQINCRLDGHKFLDVDGNSLWEPDEPPLEGWEIRLSDGRVTHTDADGYYAFEDLPDGTYTVREDCPADWAQTAPGLTDFDTCGDSVHTAEINLDNREVSDLDFGNGRPALSLTCTSPSDVFVGDDIEYKFTVTNAGNVLLEDIVVAFRGIDETLSLAPGEARTFSRKIIATTPSGRSDLGRHRIYLPLVLRGAEVQVMEAHPLQEPWTTTAVAQYALATVEASARCETQIHELAVTKNFQTGHKRQYQCAISKEVDNPGPIVLRPNDSPQLVYTVTAGLGDPPFVDRDWIVEGTITIDNPAPIEALLDNVVDKVSPDIPDEVKVDCPPYAVPPYAVPPEGSLTCVYGPIPLPNGADRTNTATATLRNNNGRTTDFETTVIWTFDGAMIEEIDEEGAVYDEFPGVDKRRLGNWRYDQPTRPFTDTWTIPPPGDECDLYVITNTARMVLSDTLKVCTDTVKVFAFCTVTVGYEDLPITSTILTNDWDYNDLVIDIVPKLDLSPEGKLLSVTFTVIQQTVAGPKADPVLTGFTHEFHLQPDADAIPCDGSYTLETTTGGGTVVATEPYTRGKDFLLIPDTADPPDLIKLRIDFDAPPGTGCPFEFSNFDPVNQHHGEWLFFDPWIFVNNTEKEIRVIKTPGKFEPRLLTVPVDWQWPTGDGCHVWCVYKGVSPPPKPESGPTFGPLWWKSGTNCQAGCERCDQCKPRP